MYSQLNNPSAPLERLLPKKEIQEYIRILSIEGGGIRGMIPLHVIKYLEETSGKPITELFDFIVGTSSGAITSCLLTLPDENLHPRYSAEECLDFYRKDCKGIFFNPWYHHLFTLGGMVGPKYANSARFHTFHKYFGKNTLNQLLSNVAVAVYNFYDGKPLVFFNWVNPITQTLNLPVRDLLVGATSLPGIFPVVVFGSNGKEMGLADAFLYAKSPSLIALFSAATAYPNKKYIVVSLSTGKLDTWSPTEKSVGWGEAHWNKYILSMILDGQGALNQYLLENLPIVALDFHSCTPDTNLKMPAEDDLSLKSLASLDEIGNAFVDSHKKELDLLIEKLEMAL